MSRHTQRRRVQIDALVDELSIAAAQRLKTDSDECEPYIRAVVAYLVEEYPAQELYIPASANPKYPVERIRAALRDGQSVRSICKQYGVGRWTVYRISEEAESQKKKYNLSMPNNSITPSPQKKSGRQEAP